MSDSQFTVTVQLFAAARERAGSDSIDVIMMDGETVATLRRKLVELSPEIAPLADSLLIAIDNAYAADDALVTSGCEIAAFPPVSGG